MRSRAAIGGHPLHPAMVAIPIGAWTVTLIADVLRYWKGNPVWGDVARYALIIGIVGALAAAVLGFIDFFTVKMSQAGGKIARIHMILNLIAVALFGLSLWWRLSMPEGWCVPGFVASTIAYLIISVSGYLGGELVFKHKIGVLEHADAEATELGRRESV